MTDAAAPIAQVRGVIQLAIAIVVISVVWLVLLPQLSSRPETAAYLRQLDQQGIDPSAMYYTELEMMDELLSRIEKPHRAPLNMSH